MTTLLTFGTLCFATCALKAGGAQVSAILQVLEHVDSCRRRRQLLWRHVLHRPASAGGCILFAVMIFTMIHFFSPPKPWGDVTRNITYHFVRKYLLRLDERKGHVKYWRPQILLWPTTSQRMEPHHLLQLAQEGCSLRPRSRAQGRVYRLPRRAAQAASCLAQARRLDRIKSFVDVVIARTSGKAPAILILSCGLGGMRPNIVVMGYPSDMRHPAKVARSTYGGGHRRTEARSPSRSFLAAASSPRCGHGSADGRRTKGDSHQADDIRRHHGGRTRSQQALAIAYGFDLMQPPTPATSDISANTKERQEAEQRYIDLWPVQIASPDADESHAGIRTPWCFNSERF